MPSGAELVVGCIWFTKYTEYVYFACSWPSYSAVVKMFSKLCSSLWFGMWLGKGIDLSGDL